MNKISLYTQKHIAQIKLLANRIDTDLILELNQALDQLESQEGLSILAFQGMEDFCLGIDKESFLLMDEAPHITIFQKWEKLCHRIEKINLHTVIGVKGQCSGFGLSLVLACDIRFVSSTATFHIEEPVQGFLPPIAVLNLGKYLGLGRAKNLILQGSSFSAVEAIDWGLATQLFEQNSFDEDLQAYLDDSMVNNKEAILLTRRLLSEAFSLSYEDFIGSYLAAQHRAINQEDFAKVKHQVLYD